MSLEIIYALLSVIIVSALSLIGLVTISINEKKLRNFLFILVALAIGALLGDAFIHLIPESIEGYLGENSMLVVIGGILLFFTLEKIFRWHHIHTTAEHSGHIIDSKLPAKTLGYMVLVSDGFHNLIDGIIIGASYLINIEAGIATTIAIILHEIPQEIGDFGVLLHAGFTKAKALLFNFLSATFAIIGALFAIIFGANEQFLGWMIPLAAGSFIYVAIADLVPELHKQKGRKAFIEVIAILIGIAAIYYLRLLEK